MNCKGVQERFVEYLLGDAPESDVRLVEDHLRRGCANCLHELEQLRVEIHGLYDLLPARRASDDQVGRIYQSVMRNANPSVDPPAELEPSGLHRFSIYDGLLWATSFAAGLLFVLASSGPGLSPPTTNSTVRAAPSAANSETENQNQIVLTSMDASGTSSLLSGVLLYDSYLGQLHLFVPSMAEPPTGRQYVLKIIQGANEVTTPIRISPDGVGTASVDVVSRDEAQTAIVELKPVTESGSDRSKIS